MLAHRAGSSRAWFLGWLALGAALLLAPAAALAQGTAANPAATVDGQVPSAEGNVWNGLDHQPTASDVPPIADTKQNQQINNTLDQLNRQLQQYQLPKVPPGAPQPSGNP
ncbi:hypothetical protein [Acidisoma sp. C75]